MEMSCDNTGTISITNEPEIMKGAKHYQRKYHYIREIIEMGEIIVNKVHTDDNVVDPFTKPMPLTKHTKHVRSIELRLASHPELYKRGVWGLDFQTTYDDGLFKFYQWIVFKIDGNVKEVKGDTGKEETKVSKEDKKSKDKKDKGDKKKLDTKYKDLDKLKLH
ncbi:hypothetical protein Tco_0247988 [Tanacetum coccineum]